MLKKFDLDKMERLNAKFHAELGDVRREGDTVWRIPRRGGGEIYLVLLLDFQSSVDHWMALRTLVYVGLLWQHLVKEKRLLPGDRLPPVLPVVLYNGRRRWGAARSVRECVGLPEGSPLWCWQPQACYHIIDEGAVSEDELARRDTLTALLFRSERSPDQEQALKLAAEIAAWFKRHPGFEELRSVFSGQMQNVFGPIVAEVMMMEDLAAMRSMLAANAEKWNQQLKQQGKREGKREGKKAFLVRLLEHRFGALPDWARERIAPANSAALEQWGLRVLEAGSLEDVLR